MNTYPYILQRHFARSGDRMVVLQCAIKRCQLGFGRCRTALCVAERNIDSTTMHALQRALCSELKIYTAVVLPLTKFYPIATANMRLMSLETDVNVLNNEDAKLYRFLCTHFCVAVVTVCYHCIDGMYSGCVLDMANSSAASHNGGDPISGTDAEDILILPMETGYGSSARNRASKTDSNKVVSLVTSLSISCL